MGPLPIVWNVAPGVFAVAVVAMMVLAGWTLGFLVDQVMGRFGLSIEAGARLHPAVRTDGASSSRTARRL